MMTQTDVKELITDAELPVRVPHVVSGERLFNGREFSRENPSHPDSIVSVASSATAELVQRAVDASRAAQHEWSRVPIKERAARVRAGLEYLEAEVDNWAVRAALETGKPWGDARVEALETIQFLKIYPDYAEQDDYIVDPRATSERDQYTHGEIINESLLRPYGVFGVITPFNYPAALASGPAIAAIIAGNGVVIKTSSLAPWTGFAVYELFEAMDLPTGLVNVIHGGGRELVNTDIDGFAFTGSAETGRNIARAINEGPYPRPFIAEMGGKNPLIVTGTADLDQAARAIVYSSFHLSGQKCSALSRVLVADSVHDALVEKVASLIGSYSISAPEFGGDLGPVITPEAMAKYEKILAEAEIEGYRTWQGGKVPDTGYFVPPLLIADVPVEHRLAVDEHFLPVVTLCPVPDFEAAIEAANSSIYGLTAGIFTGDDDEAREFVHRIEAGCINVNIDGHGSTGWWPGPQTFGGWKGSGSTGTQGFGKWYLHQFMREQAIKLNADQEHFLDELR